MITMLDSKLVMYNVEWQALRVSLLGNWPTVQGATENLAKLDAYLGNEPNKSKLWRVLNLINATRMGYSGQGLKGTPQDDLVKSFGTEVRSKYNLRCVKHLHDKFEVDTEAKILADWAQLSEEVQKKIRKNLAGRLKAHSTSEHRDELRWFLDIIK